MDVKERWGLIGEISVKEMRFYEDGEGGFAFFA